MVNNLLKKSFNIYLIISLILVLMIIGNNIYTHYLIKNNEDSMLILSAFKSINGSEGLKHRYLKKEDSKYYTFTTTIAGDEFDKLNGQDYKFIAYRLTGNWYKVYLNNILIGSLGDIDTGHSNIWNSLSVFSIDKKLVEEDNKLRIEISGDYEIGLLNFPIIITNSYLGNKILTWFNFFTDNFNIFVIGILVSGIIRLLIIYIFDKSLGKEYLYYCLAGISMLVAILNQLTIIYLPMSFINFKRFIIIGNSLAVFFISLAIYERFKRKYNLFLAYILLLILFFSLIISSDMIELKKYFYIINILSLVNAFAWLCTMVEYVKDSYEVKALFIGTIFGSYDIINNLVLDNTFYGMRIEVFRFIIFAMTIILLIVFHYVELHKRIEDEKNKCKLMYERAIKDQMTGIYNHQYIINKLEETKKFFSLIMIDLDNFKEINDNYGHQMGDFVIKYAAEEMKKNIRADDLLGRYGGDEFIIVLFGCEREVAQHISARIKQDIESPHYSPEGIKLEVTASIGIYSSYGDDDWKDAINKADQALYSAKRGGKSKINTY
ncbi:GGDEF domain-containing protein [Orenia marismortui]|uniref:Diguanylate cyclase (GGDEF)-like protein n=1 Tax=Orenia marismortui TaxID=46469 RepID=A0A4R8H5D7_9FIRM|nr:GGDEF domain-containing protein [Orenia marismortui]TDX52379.1 diguanylate cyclase (GGDEF)-like protein [Orenia marismortui]